MDEERTRRALSLSERQYTNLLNGFQGEGARNAAQAMITKLVDNQENMAQQLQQQQQTATAIATMTSEIRTLTEAIAAIATGNHPRDQGPKESIVWKPLQIDSTADEYKYVIWKERFLNQLSRVKVDAIPLNYVLCSEEDLRRMGVTTAPADPNNPTDYEHIVITGNAKREVFRIMGDILEGQPRKKWSEMNKNGQTGARELLLALDELYASQDDLHTQRLLEQAASLRITPRDDAVYILGLFDDKIDALMQRGRDVTDPEKYTMLLNMIGTNLEYEQTLDTYQTNIAMQDQAGDYKSLRKIILHKNAALMDKYPHRALNAAAAAANVTLEKKILPIENRRQKQQYQKSNNGPTRPRPTSDFILTNGRRTPCSKCGNHIIKDTPCATSPPTCTRPHRDRSSRMRPDTNIDPINPRKIFAIKDNFIDNNAFIWDTGSEFHFAPRDCLVPNTFVQEPRTFGSASGTDFTSPGHGELLITVATNTGDTIQLHLENVYAADIHIIGNRLEHGQDLRGHSYEVNTRELMIIVSSRDTPRQTVIPLRFNGQYMIDTVRDALLVTTTDSNLIHRRIAHRHLPGLQTPRCFSCAVGKYRRRRGHHDFGAHVRGEPGTRWHLDLKNLLARTSNNYVIRFLDPASNFIVDILCHSKLHTTIVKALAALRDMLIANNINMQGLHSDQEFDGRIIRQWTQAHHVQHTFSAAHTPTSNPIVERSFWTTEASVRAVMMDNELGMQFFEEIWLATTYVHNRLPDHRQRHDLRAPIAKLLSGDPPDLSRLRALGCRCVIPNHRRRHNKQHDPGLAGTMVGYSADSYAYRIGLANGSVIEAANVVFFENNSPRKPPTSDPPSLPDHLVDLQPIPPVSYILHTDLRSPLPPSIVLAVPGLTSPPPLLRIDAETPTAHPDNNDLREWKLDWDPTTSTSTAPTTPGRAPPRNYLEAIKRDPQKYLAPTLEEYQNLQRPDRPTFKLIPPAEVQRRIQLGDTAAKHPIPLREVYIDKFNSANEFVKTKCRVVAGGHLTRPGLHYDETYAPTSKHETLRTFLYVAAQLRRKIRHADVVAAYVHALQDSKVYARIPAAWPDMFKERPARGSLLQFLRALYGLKGSARNWCKHVTKILVQYGLTQSLHDPSLFIGAFTIVIIYVDDLLIAARNEDDYNHFMQYLGQHLDIKDLGPAKHFLGLVVDQTADTITIHQDAYIAKILQTNPPATTLQPATPTPRIITDEASPHLTGTETTTYRGIVGIAGWVQSMTRPDCAVAASRLGMAQSAPTRRDAQHAQRFLAYLQTTNNKKPGSFHIKYSPSTASELHIDIYSDSDWADELHRRSRGGYIIMANRQLLDWRAWIQSTIALSSTEAELIAAAEAITQYRFLALILADMGLFATKVILHVDNQAAIDNIKNPMAGKRTKHLDIKTKMIRLYYDEGMFEVQWIPSADNIADALTKMASQPVFERHRNEIFGRNE